MGFWQGMNEGLTYIMDKRAREKELAQAKEERQLERDLRAKEREEDRAFERQMFQEKLLESRRETLFQLLGKRRQTQAEASQFAGKAQSLAGRFADIDDPRVGALLSNPMVAANIEDQIRQIEIDRAKADIDLPPLTGQVLLDLITVQTPDGGYQPVELNPEDILELDVSDRAQYEGAMLDLSRTQPVPDVRIAPEAFRKIAPETLKEGRAAFDQEVIRLANQALQEASDDPAAYTQIRTLLDNAGKEGSPEMVALRDLFGMQALGVLESMGSPYIQNLEQDPQLLRYSQMLELNRIINDPSTPEDRRSRAEGLLRRLQGGL